MAEIIIPNDSSDTTEASNGVKIVNPHPEKTEAETPEEVEAIVETETEVETKVEDLEDKADEADEAPKEEAEDESDEKEDESKDEAHWKKFARQHESEKKKALAENEKLSKELEKTKNELKDTIRKYETNEVINELGLNDKQVKFLTGENKTELLASGRELLEAFGGNTTEKPIFKQGVSKNDDIAEYTGEVTLETAYADWQRRRKNA